MSLPLFTQDERPYPRTLEELKDQVMGCNRCPLYGQRNQPVIGEGNLPTDIMLIGEAPGEQEDLSGKAFVGPAGQLLTKILAAINFRREDVYITNVMKCRPPGNRTPADSEISSCLPWLHRQIELVQPKLVLCLGKVAGNALLSNRLALSCLRGRVHGLREMRVIVTYHPAALLRNPAWKRGCWEDVKALRRLYDADTIGRHDGPLQT